MRLSFITLILATTSLSTAFAADLKSSSHVDAVTVYPSGAEVTRVAEAHLVAGDTTLILEDLPGELDAQSIRVEGVGGAGLEIGSVDSKPIYLSSESQDAERLSLEKQVETLQDERQALDQTLSDADYQKKLLLSLADRQLAPPSGDGKTNSIDATQLGSLLDLVSVKLNGISKAIHESQLRQRDIDKLVGDLQNKMEGIAPTQVSKMQVAVHLTAPAETDGTFKVKYRVGNAGWAPFYDARLTTPDKNQKSRIELVRRAEVMQSSGESWDNVALTLSTARPLGATSAPDLNEQEIQIYEPLAEKMKAENDALARSDEGALAPATAAPKETLALGGMLDKKDAIQRQAVVEIAGFQALYGIQGRVSVDNSGTSKKVRIATDNYEGTLNALVVPKLDLSAYLTASFIIRGEAPLLPGAINLYRDGVFMGQGALPMLSPDEEAKLGFGADDLIKVKRSEVKRRKGEEGLISTSNVEERAWDIAVKNLHDIAIPVTVIDQLPFSANENVVVEPMVQMTKPSEKDFNKRRGVLAWQFDLASKAENTIKFGYKVTWPQNMQVGMNLE